MTAPLSRNKTKFAEKRDDMKKKTGKGNTTMTEIANVLLDHDTVQTNTIEHNAHFNGLDNGDQTQEDIMSARHKEKLSFQEWTAKYHQ